MSSELAPPQHVSRRGLRRAAVIGAIVILVILVAGIFVRVHDSSRVKSWTQAQAVPTVAVIEPSKPGAGPALALPGRLEAWSRAPILARVNGYLKSWSVDIGAHVKAGQELAVIETPEIDQQLLQAKADLASAEANASLARTTAQRWQSMLGSDAVSRQEVDERTSDYEARKAAVAAAQANVNRLIATKGFARIVAPFDGVVTSRDTDVGALINAGGSRGQELFTVSDVTKLRVYVQVPQNYAPSVRPGTEAELTVPEYPGQVFKARVMSSAGAVNAQSGTTLVQLEVPNPDGKLMPGAFANLAFHLPAAADTLRVPASALVFDAHGMRVATLDANDRVHFKKVTVARDLGTAVEIGAGLSPTDRIVDTPPDGLTDGDTVKVAGAKDAAGGGNAGAARTSGTASS